MGQQSSQAIQFCCTACSACSCCDRSDYDQLDKLGLMNNNQGIDYQSNGIYDKDEQKKQLSSSSSSSSHRNEKTKFRSFIIAFNKHYGYLLLRAYKKGKGIHYQLPGGHIDKHELHGHSFEEAAKMAAKRELFEETGLNILDDSRLKYLKLGIKNRVYFQLLLKDEDSLHINNDINKLTSSLNEKQSFYLKLSDEHNGFEFEKDINRAIKMIKLHSAGNNSNALNIYAQKAKHERRRSRSHSHSQSQSKTESYRHSVSFSQSNDNDDNKDKKRKKERKSKKDKSKKDKKKKDKDKKVYIVNDD